MLKKTLKNKSLKLKKKSLKLRTNSEGGFNLFSNDKPNAISKQLNQRIDELSVIIEYLEKKYDEAKKELKDISSVIESNLEKKNEITKPANSENNKFVGGAYWIDIDNLKDFDRSSDFTIWVEDKINDIKHIRDKIYKNLRKLDYDIARPESGNDYTAKDYKSDIDLVYDDITELAAYFKELKTVIATHSKYNGGGPRYDDFDEARFDKHLVNKAITFINQLTKGYTNLYDRVKEL